jgi:hypothetical protein
MKTLIAALQRISWRSNENNGGSAAQYVALGLSISRSVTSNKQRDMARKLAQSSSKISKKARWHVQQ